MHCFHHKCHKMYKVLAQVVGNDYLNRTKPDSLIYLPLEVKNLDLFNIKCNAVEYFRPQIS